jgi:formylglycine-generating enzyme required for sulfatase activity
VGIEAIAALITIAVGLITIATIVITGFIRGITWIFEKFREEQKWESQLAAICEYREAIKTEWSETGAGKELFVKLSLQLGLQKNINEQHKEETKRFPTINEALAAVEDKRQDTRAVVLLGLPGTGKSTLLQNYDLEAVKQGLRKGSEQNKVFSYFTSLQDYGPDSKEPLEWLEDKWNEEWQKRHGFEHLQSLDELLRSHNKSYLLLDALNEMTHGSTEEYTELVTEWKNFISLAASRYPDCRFIFSCRSHSYSVPLDFDNQKMVPHIVIEDIDEETRIKFLKSYTPGAVDGESDAEKNERQEKYATKINRQIISKQQEKLYGIAFFLKMLTEVVGMDDDIPGDRADLLTKYVIKLLKRESEKGSFQSNFQDLLAPEEIEDVRQAGGRGLEGYELFSDGTLFPNLENLAYGMQMSGEHTASTSDDFQITIKYSDAIDLLQKSDINLNDDDCRKIIQGATGLSLLDRPGHATGDNPPGMYDSRRIKFTHQLIQEYFAGRRFIRNPDFSLVDVKWKADKVPVSLEDTLQGMELHEPLPPLKSTNWEESCLFAAAMADNRNDFLSELIANDLLLIAGQAAAQFPDSIGNDLVTNIQTALLERMVDNGADLRARIAAGKVYGDLFKSNLDARAETLEYLMPAVIPVKGGRYEIGCAEEKRRHANEGPRHPVELQTFHIAETPVTNAHWALFIKDGGYDKEHLWQTEAAKAWRRGETHKIAKFVQWVIFIEMIRESNGDIENKLHALDAEDMPEEQLRKVANTIIDDITAAEEKKDDGYIERKLKNREMSKEEAIELITQYMLKSEDELRAHINAKFEKNDRIGDRPTEPSRWRDATAKNPHQPVVCICWFEAQAYCAWLSEKTGQTWRLPTEAEWEVAARMHTEAEDSYPWGDEFDKNKCNSFQSHIRASTPVGLYRSNPDHLADMSGNVFEWTSSQYKPYPYNADDGREDPSGPANLVAGDGNSIDWENDPFVVRSARVLRGGSWYYGADEARASFRLRFHPGYSHRSTGMRLVRED